MEKQTPKNVVKKQVEMWRAWEYTGTHWWISGLGRFIQYVKGMIWDFDSLDKQPDLRPSDKDLLFIEKQVQVKVSVNDVVYYFLGEISSSSESDVEGGNMDEKLEQYLLIDSECSHSQVMAHTKQTGRRQHDNSVSVSGGGLPLASNPADSDSSIKQAANALGLINMNRQSPCKQPAGTGFTLDEGTGTDGSSHLKRPHTEDDETESEQEVHPPKKTGLGWGKTWSKDTKVNPLTKKQVDTKKEAFHERTDCIME